MEEVKIHAIYKHYKGNLYYVRDIAYHHEGWKELAIVIYHKCDENGIFQSIRYKKEEEHQSIIINQPFYRLYNEFISSIQGGYPNNPAIKRFTFFKQL